MLILTNTYISDLARDWQEMLILSGFGVNPKIPWAPSSQNSLLTSISFTFLILFNTNIASFSCVMEVFSIFCMFM